jgi:hypothetical protein
MALGRAGRGGEGGSADCSALGTVNTTRGAASWRRPSFVLVPGPGPARCDRYCSGVPTVVDVSVIVIAAFEKKIVPEVFVPK